MNERQNSHSRFFGKSDLTSVIVNCIWRFDCDWGKSLVIQDTSICQSIYRGLVLDTNFPNILSVASEKQFQCLDLMLSLLL